MREAMTEHLRSALEAAQTQALELNQEFIGEEHLLLGLLAASDDAEPSEARRALSRNGVDAAELLRGLAEALPRGREKPNVTGALPFSPRARRTINAALADAQSHHVNRVSTRLLLKALLEEPDSEIRQALRRNGSDIEQLSRLLDEAPAAPEA